MRISDLSSDVCSSDLAVLRDADDRGEPAGRASSAKGDAGDPARGRPCDLAERRMARCGGARGPLSQPVDGGRRRATGIDALHHIALLCGNQRRPKFAAPKNDMQGPRSEEHTSELQSLMRISYTVFCLQKKKPVHKPI